MPSPSPRVGQHHRPNGHPDDDAAVLVDLLAAGALVATGEDPVDLAPYRAALVDIAGTPGADVLVAEQDGEVVGTCQLITFRHLQHHGGRCPEIESMHVRPDVRGNGVGGGLLEAATAAAGPPVATGSS